MTLFFISLMTVLMSASEAEPVRPTSMSSPAALSHQVATQLKVYLWNVQEWHNAFEREDRAQLACLDGSPEKLRRLIESVERSERRVNAALFLGDHEVISRETRQTRIADKAGQRLFRDGFECTQLALAKRSVWGSTPAFETSVSEDLTIKEVSR